MGTGRKDVFLGAIYGTTGPWKVMVPELCVVDSSLARIDAYFAQAATQRNDTAASAKQLSRVVFAEAWQWF